jgi:hypothetical protein
VVATAAAVRVEKDDKTRTIRVRPNGEVIKDLAFPGKKDR